MRERLAEIHIGRLSLRRAHRGGTARIREQLEQELSRLFTADGSAPAAAPPERLIDALRGKAPAAAAREAPVRTAARVHDLIAGRRSGQ